MIAGTLIHFFFQTPESSSSLELASTPQTVVEVKSLASSERQSSKSSHPDFTKSKDASKLSVILSHTIPLSSHGTGGDSVPRSSAHVPNVNRVRIERPSTVLKHHSTGTPRHDHNYCIQAFDNTHSPARVMHDRSYHFCLHADYGICSSIPPNIAWGLPYSPATVTRYQVCPAQDYPSPASCDTSSCWGMPLDTKEDLLALRNVGLTRINMERLAETGCISESLFPHDKSRDERRQDRIKERRETFLSVMQEKTRSHQHNKSSSKPRYEDMARKNPIIGKWLALDTLSVDETSRLLDDTADILYGRRKALRERLDETIAERRPLPPPSALLFTGRNHRSARRQPPQGYRHPATFSRGTASSSPQRQRARVISSVRRKLHFDCGSIPVSTMTAHTKVSSPPASKIHRKIRKLFARSSISKCISKELLVDTRHNQEQTRSICSRENSVTSLELDDAPCKDSGTPKSSSVQESTENRNDKASVPPSQRRSLRSRTINISTKTKQLVQGRGARREQKKSDDSKPEDVGQVDAEPVDNSAEDWIKLSEDWIKEPLDMTTILPLL